ncbi:MAG: hypothetical protein CMP24_04675 [Rickettsiales bacterium]|nr:hypothetical protein [Rickettsiales bacterium]|tara:strand:- start:422 stop:1093 length:672 start_codon:yes stop_codon:yes gene_type:complete
MKYKNHIITIDGPAASGKGTISKVLAEELELYHIETGLFYRILALEYLKVKNYKISLSSFLEKLDKKIFFGSTSNKNEIYDTRVTDTSSLLAKKAIIRKFIVKAQKDLIKSHSLKYKGIILDGRDCGTVIAPQAVVKIFITAKLEVRAMRRFEQISKKNDKILYKNILLELSKRDERDVKRKNSPLYQARGSYLVDSSELNLIDTIKIVKKIILSKLPYLEIK